MKDDDIYVRYQTMAAFVGILFHDLRNPIHSAVLVVDSMGSRAADLEALRTKMRAQLGKLEVLIAQAAEAIKDLTIEPRIVDAAVDDLLRTAASFVRTESENTIELEAPPAPGLRVVVDSTLVVRAIREVAATVVERSDPAPSGTGVFRVAVAVEQPNATSVRLILGEWLNRPEDSAPKVSLGGGSIRLSLARALLQAAGASLRFESPAPGRTRCSVDLRRAGVGALPSA